MIFSSIHFVFLFLPIVLIVYCVLTNLSYWTLSKIWLVSASLFFYGYWDINYLKIIIFSIIFNYYVALLISNRKVDKKNAVWPTLLGILTNLLLLFYFKYLYFFDSEILTELGHGFSIEKIILPLGISFFTFQQIAFLVDINKGYKLSDSFLNYTLFVSFFPQLIAGPIVHHSEMMPQFSDTFKRSERWDNLKLGIFIFSIGLFKKVVIADTLSSWVDSGFSNPQLLNSLDAWLLSFAYTFQLYYDFSGYADMAIGIALMFSIKLPINFMSPYRAISIQDFWRRWHMTLSRWFRDYVYIPLGGNKEGETRTFVNVFLTAFVSGIWHGAGWTFIIWGALHGSAMVLHRMWQKTGLQLNWRLSLVLTFLFINFTWVFFRAEDLDTAIFIVNKMMELPAALDSLMALLSLEFVKDNLQYIGSLPTTSRADSFPVIVLFIVILFLLEFIKSSDKEYFANKVLSKKPWLTPFLLTISIWFMSVETVEKFIYFNF